MCFICNATVALPKKANIEIHFQIVHKNHEEDYPRGTALIKAKVQQLKVQLTAQQNRFFQIQHKGEDCYDCLIQSC